MILIGQNKIVQKELNKNVQFCTKIFCPNCTFWY